MESCSGEGKVNSFAVVGYLPEPLAGFVNRLRHELVPECHARAHITVVPPRPLSCAPEAAWNDLRKTLETTPAFEVELKAIERFQRSDVIYISVGAGFKSLERLHSTLCQGHCQSPEVWHYQPHVTLAQELDPAVIEETLALATRRWREFAGPRSFLLDHMTFVQNTLENRWVDLADCDLRPPVLV